MSRRIDIAKTEGFDIGYDDHNLPTIYGEFEYEDGGRQGIGAIPDMNFIIGFCKAFDAMKLEGCNGKIVKVEHDNYHIYKIIPLRFNSGKVFDIEEWANNIVRY